ncbi:MAG TPA: FAD-dependent oxidoreductase [Candidatus Nitrosotenuis sp.]
MQKFDFAIIGGGILGTTTSYWLSSLYDARVCVIEKDGIASHASSKNTGVVHSPFYLDPQKRKTIAKAALASHGLWKDFALAKNISWKQCGTIEVALDEKQHKTLEKYDKWGKENGISDNELELLDSTQVSKKEPNVRCYSGIYCSRDASTDYGALTNELSRVSEKQGTKLLLGHHVQDIKSKDDGIELGFDDGSNLECKFLINCAGGHSLDIAKKLGIAQDYSTLHFRGEYWIAQNQCANLVNTNIYSVAKFSNFPFLDPHWVKRANGQTEIGPNAVPVADPETYSGYVGNIPKTLSKLREILSGNSRKLLFNSEFLTLVSKEWKSSLSKTAMVNRVKQFIPAIKPSFFTKRGTAGIRSPVITKKGEFLPEILELETKNSLHIINYNSPGATGAPAYAAFMVKKLQDKGILNLKTKQNNGIWDFQKIIEQMP